LNSNMAYRECQVDDDIVLLFHPRVVDVDQVDAISACRSSHTDTISKANPPSASSEPTQPVDVHPSPWEIASPPRKGPSAFARLKAEWFSAAARPCALRATSMSRV